VAVFVGTIAKLSVIALAKVVAGEIAPVFASIHGVTEKVAP